MSPPLPIGFPKASPVIHAEARITGLTSGRTADRGGKDSYAWRTGVRLIGCMFTQNFMGFHWEFVYTNFLELHFSDYDDVSLKKAITSSATEFNVIVDSSIRLYINAPIPLIVNCDGLIFATPKITLSV